MIDSSWPKTTGSMKLNYVSRAYRLFLFSVFTASAVIARTLPSWAVDTVEPFNVGATDAELYLGFNGIGLDKNEKTIYSDTMLGYGVLPGLSLYLGVALEANEHFADGTAGIYTGVYGTPVDTDHFDLDLFLDISCGGAHFEQFTVEPAIEMNLDLDPEMNSFGAYTRFSVPIYGLSSVSQTDPEEKEYETRFHLAGVLGTYYSIASRHQLLLEFEIGLHPKPMGFHELDNEEEPLFEIGGFALGYNALLNDSFELISQFFWDIPNDDEKHAFGFMLGFIATLPRSGYP